MADDDQGQEGNEEQFGYTTKLGLGAAFGVAGGTVIFAITGNAFWIAIGPAFGVAIAAALGIKGD